MSDLSQSGHMRCKANVCFGPIADIAIKPERLARWNSIFVLRGLSSAQRLHPSGYGLSDLVRRIFLDEVNPLDRQLGQVWPGAHCGYQLCVGQNRARLDLEPEFWESARRQPVGIGLDCLMDVCGISVDRNLPGPCQGRPAIFTRRRVRAPIFRHLLVCQRPDDRLGKNLLDEEVVFQNHLLAGVTADRLQYRAHTHTVPMILALRARDRFHECDPFYRVAMPVRPVEAQARAPVVEDKGNALANAQSLKQRFEIATMLDEPIRAGPAVG